MTSFDLPEIYSSFDLLSKTIVEKLKRKQEIVSVEWLYEIKNFICELSDIKESNHSKYLKIVGEMDFYQYAANKFHMIYKEAETEHLFTAQKYILMIINEIASDLRIRDKDSAEPFILLSNQLDN